MASLNADRVWDRAAELAGREGPRAGDSALSALLLAHGSVMSGGVLHCVGSLSSEELDAAVNGCRHLGFDRVADALTRARVASPRDMAELEDQLNREYALAIPDDAALVEAFRSDYRAHPETYGP